MVVRRSPLGHEVAAPAKLNLFLEVLGKRSDGFHEIETLMLPISLYDSLSIRACDEDRLSLIAHEARKSRTPRETVPDGDTNLIIRALRLLKERSGVERGAEVTLAKRIPMAAGLAGGSSDAAAALLLGNEAWGLGWSRDRLASVAAELGCDIPFFLGRGAAVCRGRGEKIEPIDAVGKLHFVVVAPEVGLSTADVYRRYSPSSEPRNVAPLVDALRTGRLVEAARHLTNRLQQAAAGLCDWIDRLRDEFSKVDCIAHQMSGSGTSYFGLCRNALHARRIAECLQSRRLGRVYAVGNCC